MGRGPRQGRVAYRRIASVVLAHRSPPPPPTATGQGSLGESLTTRPGRAFGRFVRKAALALLPYEGQDLEIAEQLDRRLRPRLPWGFFLPLIAFPWIALSPLERWRQLAGLLVLAGLAFAVQVALYASAVPRPRSRPLWERTWWRSGRGGLPPRVPRRGPSSRRRQGLAEQGRRGLPPSPRPAPRERRGLNDKEVGVPE